MYPNKKQSIILVAFLFAIEFIVSLYLAWAGVSWSNGNPVIDLFVNILSCLLILVFALPKMGLKARELFHANFNNLGMLLRRSIVPILLLMATLQVILSYLNSLLSGLLPEGNYISQHIAILLKAGPLGFLYMCVVGPVIEEVIFRGVILRGLLANYKSGDALVTSAVLFSLVHLNPSQLFHTLIVGLVLGWIYMGSYSLWPSIVAHMSFNMMAYAEVNSALSFHSFYTFPILLIMGVLAAMSLFLLKYIFVYSMRSP